MSYSMPYVFSEGRDPVMRAFLVLAAVFPTIAVILRFWSRALLPNTSNEKPISRFWWDDWMVLLATVRS